MCLLDLWAGFFFWKGAGMPELPEVEYVARQLRQTLIGRTLSDVRVNWPRTIAHPDADLLRRTAWSACPGH